MELNVTEIAREILSGKTWRGEYSASVSERGSNAGRETWVNATARAEAWEVPTEAYDELRAQYRDYYGAWDDAEIASWSATDIRALVVQEVAWGLGFFESWAWDEDPERGPEGVSLGQFEQAASSGTHDFGRIFPGGDSEDLTRAEWYYYIGN